MNLVVPQQVKDRFAVVQDQVRGQIVALQQLAGTNYAEAQKRLDQLPVSVTELWIGLRARLQGLLDFAPRTELLSLQQSVDELGIELGRLSAERDLLRGELLQLVEEKLAAISLPVAAESVTIEAEAEAVVETEAPAKAERPAAASNGKAKNGNQRRR